MVYELVVVGTSWGGLHAVEAILSALPRTFQIPIVVVQHRRYDSDDTMRRLLQKHTPLRVREVEDKEPIRARSVYLAPPDYHLLLDRSEQGTTFALSTDEPVAHSRPSIDVFFSSAAEVFGNRVVAAILSGANHDGAEGMVHIKRAGGMTLAQDPSSAECGIMPEGAIARGVVDRVLTLQEMAVFLGTLAAPKTYIHVVEDQIPNDKTVLVARVISRPNDMSALATPLSAPGSAMSAISVLLVDDQPQNLLALEAVLEPLGVELVKAHSGQEALKRLLTQDFAVILLDVQMPTMDGFETASIMKERERSRHIPIIFLTAISKDEAYVFKGYTVGAVDYISKPLDANILRSKVQVFVELYRKTQQLKAQEKLLRENQLAELRRVSEKRYRDLAESMPQIVWMENEDSEITYRNQRWFDCARLSPQDARALEWKAVLHESDVERFRRDWMISVSEGRELVGEFRFGSRETGNYRWHLVRVVLLAAADENEQLSWVGTSTDIDDRKRAEERLQFLAEASTILASSIEYKNTFAALAECVVKTQADAFVIHLLEEGEHARRLVPFVATAATTGAAAAIPGTDFAAGTAATLPTGPAAAATGTTRGPATPATPAPHGVGDFWREMAFNLDPDSEHGPAYCLKALRGEVVPEVTEEIRRALAKDEAHLAALSSLPFMSYACAPIVARGRSLGAISFISTDSQHRYTSTKLELAEDLAQRMASAIDVAELYALAEGERAKLEQVNRAKDDFLATLSHELRTPLNAMLGWTQLLRTGELEPPEYERALETIERNAKAQAQLIANLLDVSRIITGKLHLTLGAVELRKVVEAAVNGVRLTAQAKKLTIETSVADNVPSVRGDPNRLLQVLGNLLSNAVKFTPTGGTIAVRLEEAESSVQMTVTDTGQGITPEFLPYVFDRFRQADSTSTRAQGGLGLGLAIVSHLVKLHGGTVKAHSDGKGQGSTFVVSLPVPLIQPDAEAKTPDSDGIAYPSLRSSELQSVRVLLVEDEPDGQGIAIVVLERAGATVTAASNVEEAMQAIAASPPDVIVSDIGLPGEDGYVLIRKVRALGDQGAWAKSNGRGRIFAVALTAYAAEQDRANAFEAGFDAHVAKPVEPMVLISTISRLLRRSGRPT